MISITEFLVKQHTSEFNFINNLPIAICNMIQKGILKENKIDNVIGDMPIPGAWICVADNDFIYIWQDSITDANNKDISKTYYNKLIDAINKIDKKRGFNPFNIGLQVHNDKDLQLKQLIEKYSSKLMLLGKENNMYVIMFDKSQNVIDFLKALIDKYM